VKWPFYAGTYKVSCTAPQTVNITAIATIQVYDGNWVQQSGGGVIQFGSDVAHNNLHLGVDNFTNQENYNVARLFRVKTGHYRKMARGSLPWGGWNDNGFPNLAFWYSISNDDHRYGASWDDYPVAAADQQAYQDSITGTPSMSGGPCKYQSLVYVTGLWHVWCE
jgi:hypothetical protein